MKKTEKCKFLFCSPVSDYLSAESRCSFFITVLLALEDSRCLFVLLICFCSLESLATICYLRFSYTGEATGYTQCIRCLRIHYGFYLQTLIYSK